MNLSEFYQLNFDRLTMSLTYFKCIINIAAQLSKKLSKSGSAMKASSLSKKEITAMLRAWSAGEHEATEELIRSVYRELRLQARHQLRRERANHTLHTTALINEVYIKLVEQRSVKWENRGHFFALAAKLMRRILVDHAKTRHRKRRGGAEENVALDDVLKTNALAITDERALDLLALDEALERLAKIDQQQVHIVELRYFSGLDVPETAEILNVSTATVKRDWAVARAWLKHELTRGENP